LLSPREALAVGSVAFLGWGSHSPSPAFDPKPFINTFEAAVDKLIAVRKDVQSKTEQMEKGVRISEREYSKKMAELNRGFEVCATDRFPLFHSTRC
jgi:hypothetical protein